MQASNPSADQDHTSDLPLIGSHSRILLYIAALLLIVTLVSFKVTLSDLKIYPGADLRAKVVGSRLLVSGQNPYVLHPNSDPDYVRAPFVAFTSPATLLLYAPLQKLPFSTQRSIYFAFDWILGGVAFYLITRLCRSRDEILFCWCVFALFVLCHFAFRLHLERGQYYLFMLALTCQSACAIRNRASSWQSSAPTALLIAMRPTYAVLLLAGFLYKEMRRWSVRVVTLAAAVFLLTVLAGSFHSWRQFSQAVQAREVDNIDFMCDRLPPTPPQGLIEGRDYTHLMVPRSNNGSLDGLIAATHLPAPCRLPKADFARDLKLANTAGTALTFALGLFLVVQARKRRLPENTVVILLLAWPIVLELFLPERYYYSSVMEVLPLLLILLIRPERERASAKTFLSRWQTSLLLLAIIPAVSITASLHQTASSLLILDVLPLALLAFCAEVLRAGPYPKPINGQDAYAGRPLRSSQSRSTLHSAPTRPVSRNSASNPAPSAS